MSTNSTQKFSKTTYLNAYTSVEYSKPAFPIQIHKRPTETLSLWVLFTQSCSDHFVRVCTKNENKQILKSFIAEYPLQSHLHDTSAKLGSTSGQHEIGKTGLLLWKLNFVDDWSEVLVEHKLNDSFGDANIRRCYSLKIRNQMLKC